jgi:hypothetical protein
MAFDVFISYATPDRSIALELVDDLEARGLKCWVAPRDVPGGSKYGEVILAALEETEALLLLFSQHSNDSIHVQREVERAMHLSKTILPVRIVDLYPSGDMEYYLATLHWIDAIEEPRKAAFKASAISLAHMIGKDLVDPATGLREDISQMVSQSRLQPIGVKKQSEKKSAFAKKRIIWGASRLQPKGVKGQPEKKSVFANRRIIWGALTLIVLAFAVAGMMNRGGESGEEKDSIVDEIAIDPEVEKRQEQARKQISSATTKPLNSHSESLKQISSATTKIPNRVRGDPSIEISEFRPGKSCKLKAGEKFFVDVIYKNAPEGNIRIVAKPLQQGMPPARSSFHMALAPHFSGDGTASLWFYFEHPIVIDQVEIVFEEAIKNKEINYYRVLTNINVEWE